MKTQSEYLERGRADYERDLIERPFYHDGTSRKSWESLCPIAKYSWAKPHGLGVTSKNPAFDNLPE